MGLTYPGRAKEDHVALLAYEGQVEERHHFLPVKTWLESEVELVDGLDEGQARDLERGFHPTLLLLGNFLFEQIVEEGEIALSLLLGCMYGAVKDLPDPREPQPCEVGLDTLENQGITHIGHLTAWSYTERGLICTSISYKGFTGEIVSFARPFAGLP